MAVISVAVRRSDARLQGNDTAASPQFTSLWAVAVTARTGTVQALSPADAGVKSSSGEVVSTVLSDPLCGEGHASSDPFGELATDGPFDCAAD